MIDKQYTQKENIGKNLMKTSGIRIIGGILFALLTALTVLIYFGGRYLLDNWAELSMDEIVYHLKSTLEGTSTDMIVDGFIRYGLPAILIIVAVMIIRHYVIKSNRAKVIYTVCIIAAEICIMMAMKAELDEKVGLSAYLKAQFSNDDSDFIAENYIDPNTVNLKFPERREISFIFIWNQWK